MKYYHLLVESSGFEEEGEKIEACSILARESAKQGDFEKALDYFWRAVIYTRLVGGNDEGVLQEIKHWNSVAKEKKQPVGVR